MPYSTLQSPAIIAQSVDNALTPKLWAYSNTDSVATVKGAGYITNGQALGMQPGDVVMYVYLGSPLDTELLNVASVNTNGSVTLQ